MIVKKSAARRWGRGSVWMAFLAFAPICCALNDAPTPRQNKTPLKCSIRSRPQFPVPASRSVLAVG